MRPSRLAFSCSSGKNIKAVSDTSDQNTSSLIAPQNLGKIRRQAI